MKPLGKIGKKWLATRKEWIRRNPPNHQNYYECAICGKWISPQNMELDHIQSRSRHPELRFIWSNLQPLCHPCNSSKGSGN